MMNEQDENTTKKKYDAIIIGAGICGIIFLKYAREQGLNCVVLEKQEAVGGLWNQIPAWQDIQNRKADFAINDIPLGGVKQADVLHMVNELVRKYHLGSFLRFQHEVISAVRMNERWEVETKQGNFYADYLIAASGVQNEPRMPEVERSASSVDEFHSSHLFHPEKLKDQRVTVVGGGASGWDLIDQSIIHGAKEIHWIYRGIRWFWPTKRSKQTLWPNLRELAVVQTVTSSTDAVNAFFRWILKNVFKLFHLQEIAPREPLDARKHQIIPGRSLAITHYNSIIRSQSKIRRINGKTVSLENGKAFDTDVLLWGTGYRMNLKYLGLPEYNGITSLDELRPRLGSFIRSLDYPHLFFIGMTLIDSSSSTPFFAAIEAKSIVAHILGRCEIPIKNIPHHIVHWKLIRFFASFDHVNYPPHRWKMKYYLQAWWYAIFQNRRVRI
jgi:hypothetical protein